MVAAILGLGVASCGSATLKNPNGASGSGGGGTGTGGAGGDQREASADATGARDGSSKSSAGCPATCPAPVTGSTTGAGACVDGTCVIACGAAYPTLCSASSSCVDTTSDGKNCSVCGHDCLGGACTSGQCQPLLLAQYTGNLQTISVGAQSVYATTDIGYIGRANKDGSDLKSFAMPGFTSSAFEGGARVAEDGDRVFFVWYGGTSFQVSYCATSGCDATIVPVGMPYSQYFAVDPTDHRIFWVDSSPAQLWSAPTTGTVTGTAILGGTLLTGSNGSSIFYSDAGIFLTSGGMLERLPISGGSFSSPAVASSALTILGANDEDIFLYDGTSIVYTPIPNGTGGAPTPLIATSLQPVIDGRFAADDTSAYWVSGGVQTCEIANCAATQKALPSRSVDMVVDVGTDDQAVYWGAGSPDTDDPNMGACTVWKLAK